MNINQKRKINYSNKFSLSEKKCDNKELASFITKWKKMLQKTSVKCTKCNRSIKKFKGFKKGDCPYCGCKLRYYES